MGSKTIKYKVILLISLLACICMACERQSETKPSGFVTSDLYNRFTYLIANSDDRMGEYVRKETRDGQDWHVYEKEDLRILIRDWEETVFESHCVIEQGGEKVAEVTIPNSSLYPIEVAVYYADITADGHYDAILLGDSAVGTPAGYDWSYAYDIAKGQEIILFDPETGYLTETQEQQLMELLQKDSDFYKVFGGTFYLGDAGTPYVDFAGNVYYETAVWERPGKHLGNVMILFSYNQQEHYFEVTDYLYMVQER